MSSKRKYYSEKLLQFLGDAKKRGELWKKWSENLNLFTQPYRRRIVINPFKTEAVVI